MCVSSCGSSLSSICSLLCEHLKLLVMQKHCEAVNRLDHMETKITAVLAAIIFLKKLFKMVT